MISPYFDPDEIIITKSIVFKFIDALLSHWKKNKLKNSKNILSLLVYRASLNLMPEKDIQFIFKHFILFSNQMQEINGLMKLKGEMPNADILCDIALSKIEDGKIF